MIKVFCENYKCPYNKKLEKSIQFKFRKGHYEAFEGNECKGMCSKEDILISSSIFQNRDTLMEYACCIEAENDSQMQ